MTTTIYEIDGARLEVTVHPNLIEVTGYQDVIDMSGDNDGNFMTHHERYSGYSVPECLCKSLMAMDRADDWTEAIALIEEAGIPYVTDEDEDERETMTEDELIAGFNDALDSQGDIKIGGLTYTPSQVLEAVDPIAYRVGLSDYADSLSEDYRIEGYTD